MDLSEILGGVKCTPLSAREQQQLYSAACGLYEGGNYGSALDVFTQLALTNPFAEQYWRGLAATKQMLLDHAGALQAWALVALLKEGDPLPHFHAAECYLSLNEEGEGMRALEIAFEKAGENLPLRDKITALKQRHTHENT